MAHLIGLLTMTAAVMCFFIIAKLAVSYCEKKDKQKGLGRVKNKNNRNRKF